MKYYNRILRRHAFALAMAGMLVSAGCSKGGVQQSSGQSLARVDGYELTVHQLNAELALASPTSANDKALKSQALESLINRRLLVSEAERAELDRDPQVMQAIERQKEQILVQALLQRKAAMVGKPTADEMKAYYQANPALFADRKAYEMRQVAIPPGAVTPELEHYVDSGKSMDEVVAWLDKNNVPFSIASASRSTADLPQQIVSNLGTIGGGKLFVIKDLHRITIASLRLLKDTPVDEKTAYPQIEQSLLNRKVRDFTNTEVTRLRTAAKIEYLDQSLAPAKTDPNKHIAENGVHGAAKPDDVISKGVSGLR